jgi:HPt (histidine-containing phosphotransfer) domain-containing protein
MVDFVTKPIEPEELGRVLLRWIAAQPPSPAAGAAAPDAAQLLSSAVLQIPGLDVAQGLRRVIGSIPLYLSLLRKFVSGQRDVPDQILQALDRQDWEAAEMLAHTLKGVAGNIGATELQTLATELDRLVAERRSCPPPWSSAAASSVSWPWWWPASSRSCRPRRPARRRRSRAPEAAASRRARSAGSRPAGR